MLVGLVGVPLITPVAGFSVRPAGKLPPAKVKLRLDEHAAGALVVGDTKTAAPADPDKVAGYDTVAV